MLLEKVTSLERGELNENIERLSSLLREHGAEFVLYADNLKLNGMKHGNCLFVDEKVCDLIDYMVENKIKTYLNIDKIVYTSGKGLI